MTPAEAREVREALDRGDLDLSDPSTRDLVARALGHKPSTTPATTPPAVAQRGTPPPPRRYPGARFLGFTADGAARWDVRGISPIKSIPLPPGAVEIKE